MLKEFKAFALRGNVVDMAVGIIIGAAFGTIIATLVSEVLMPPIGLLQGNVDFSNLFSVLKDRPRLAEATWGAFPATWRGDARRIGEMVVGSFGAYVRAESILMVALGLINWAGLMLLSVTVDERIAQFALFLAVVAAFSRRPDAARKGRQ